MIKIKILSVGKTKEPWLEEAVKEYTKRLSGQVVFDFTWVKNDEQLIDAAGKEPSVFCLDPAGSQMTSQAFSSFLQKTVEKKGCRICFIIGGPEGLPPFLKSHPLISFSLMTFTHQMIRLLLVEQIYRALEIQRGSQYHK